MYMQFTTIELLLMTIITIMNPITIITITSILLTGNQIQQDPYLIVINCTMHIKVACISWWQIEAREPEITKLI